MDQNFKTISRLMAVFLAIGFMILSCEIESESEKTNEKRVLTPLQTGAVASNALEIDQQITWIAKGLVFAENNTAGLNKLFYDAAFMDDYWQEELGEAHANSNIQLSYDLQFEHFTEVQNNISGNLYDKKFFPGFEYNGDHFYNFCYIPDCDSVDTTKKHVIIPIRKKIVPPSGNETGFFLDSLGNLDSVDLDFEEAPTDDYYIWIIDYGIDLTQSNASYKRGRDWDEKFPPGFCGDGVCDRDGLIGPAENDGCQDCLDPVSGATIPADFIYEVVLESVLIDDDRERSCSGSGDNTELIESWVSGKYELCFAGAIVRDGKIYDACGTSCGLSDERLGPWEVERDDVCRSRDTWPGCNIKESGCPGTVRNIGATVLRGAKEGDELILYVTEDDPIGNKYTGTLDFDLNMVCLGESLPATFGKEVEFEDLIRSNKNRTDGVSSPATGLNPNDDDFIIGTGAVFEISEFDATTREMVVDLGGTRMVVTYSLTEMTL